MTVESIETIAGIRVPDSTLAREVTEFIRDVEDDLLFNHSRRVFFFGALQGLRRGLQPDLELLYAAAMFHDIGLTERYRTSTVRFEVDVVGVGREHLAPEALAAVTAAHPRPQFKQRILAAFNDGMKHRPQTTFGTMNADVLERFDPTFVRDNMVEHILNSTWPE